MGLKSLTTPDCLGRTLVMTLILLVYTLRGCAWTTVKCNLVLIFPLVFVNLTLDLVRSFRVLISNYF